jgi:hypothetical protein
MPVVPPSLISVSAPDLWASNQLSAQRGVLVFFSPGECTIKRKPLSLRREGIMSNLSFARIMYGASQEQHPPVFEPVSNLPFTFDNSARADSQTPAHHTQGSTIENILHNAWLALSRKK